MAKCDEGYRCDVCGERVVGLADSDLYLRFVLGEITIEQLHAAPERHLRCNPTQAQFIRHPEFEPVEVEGLFDRRMLDPEDVAQRDRRVTEAWERLLSLAGSGLPVESYPLPDADGQQTG